MRTLTSFSQAVPLYATVSFSSYTLEEKDTVALSETAFEMQEEVKVLKVPVLYEDRELLIVNKPAGLISESKSLKNCLGIKGYLELVHRLDKETSGALILAKSPEAKEKMVALFKERALRKLYLALVDGVIAKEEGTIDNFLGKKHGYQGQTVYGSVDEKKGRGRSLTGNALDAARALPSLPASRLPDGPISSAFI